MNDLFNRKARELTALWHYLPEQVTNRLWIHLRRGLSVLSPSSSQRSLRDLRDNPPAVPAIACPEALLEHALREEVCPAEQGEHLLSERFCFLNRTVQHDGRPDWHQEGAEVMPHLWRMNLHYHRFLVDAVVGSIRNPSMIERYLETAGRILADWTSSCPPGTPGGWHSAWNSYSVSTRILNAWLARQLLHFLPSSRISAFAAQLDVHGASNAAFLSRWLELDLGGNHLLRNAAALLAASRWFGGPHARVWRASAEELISEQLCSQVLPDGFHEERSPMYHALALQDVLLSGLTAGRERGLFEDMLVGHAGRMVGALATVEHADGEIALFNDSAFGIAPPPLLLRKLASALGVKPAFARGGDLDQAGYYRLENERWCVIFDAGLLGPDHLPAHAHCDALSFEASYMGERLVVDTGVDRYEEGPERDFQRSVAAHSTLQAGKIDQGEPFGSFRMGRRPHVAGHRITPFAVEGGHDGYGSLGYHHRALELCEGNMLAWTDSLAGSMNTPLAVRVCLAPGVEADVLGSSARLALPGGERLTFTCPEEGSLTVESGTYCERFGASTARPVLCWRGASRNGRRLRFTISE